MVFRLSPSRTRSAQTHSATTIVCNNRTILFPPKADLFGAIHWCWILLIELTVWPILLTLKISVKSGCGADSATASLLHPAHAERPMWNPYRYVIAEKQVGSFFLSTFLCGQRKWTSISYDWHVYLSFIYFYKEHIIKIYLGYICR